MKSNIIPKQQPAMHKPWEAHPVLSSYDETARDPSQRPRARRRVTGGAVLSGVTLVVLSFVVQPHWVRRSVPLQRSAPEATSSWSRPVALSKPAVSAESPAVAINDSGAMVAVWARQQGAIYNVQASTNTGGKWSKPINLSPRNVIALQPSVAIDNSGTATVVWSSNNMIQSSTFRPSKGWSAPVAISDLGISALAPQIVVDAAGNATAMWVRYDTRGEPALETSDCAFGGKWSQPVVLTAEAPEDFVLRVNAAGDAAAVWNSGSFASSSGIRASTRVARGSWTAAYTLASAASQQGGERIGIAANGDVTACWRTNSQIRVADKLLGGNWSLAATLYNDLAVDEFPVLAEAPSGDVMVGWMTYGRVCASTRPVAGVWAAPAMITGTQEHDEDLHAVTTADGSFVVTWINTIKGEFRSSTWPPDLVTWSDPVTIAKTQFETALAAASNTAVALWIGNSFVATAATSPMGSAPSGGQEEQYGMSSTGVALRWIAFIPAGDGQHPAVLVLHPGGFKTGKAGPPNVAQDLANAGFLALATEYRMAPPHDEMNTPQHSPPSQNTVVPIDNGYYPEQTTDIQMAIRVARRDPRCNGLVYCVGGSAGASHSAYMAATGAAGDDRPDLVVLCSGVYDLADLNFLRLVCVDDETCPHSATMNYVNRTDNFPNFSADDIAALTEASPNTYAHADMCPIFVLRASDDSLGIDIQFQDLIDKLNSMGVTETTADRPEAGHYKQWIVPVVGNHHAFEYWNADKAAVTTWLQGGPPIGR